MERTAFVLYLLVLVISPLLFGAVHTWAYTLVFMAVLTASLLLIKSGIVKKDGLYMLRWAKTGMIPLFIFFVIFLIFQMTPLPDSLLRELSPEAEMVRMSSLPASSAVTGNTQHGHWFTLTPYVYPVRMSLIRWTVYGLLFFGLVQTLNTRKRIEMLILFILAVGTFDALYGIIQTYSGSGHIWWFKKPNVRDVSGTYVNRNHFAGFMSMGIILAIGYAGAFAGHRAGRGRSAVRRVKRLKDRIIAYLSGDSLYNQRFLIVFMAVVMGLGLILSASRGGILSVAAALLSLGLLLFFRKTQRRKGIIIFVFFLLTAIYAGYAGIDYTVGRFMAFGPDHEDRVLVANRTMHIFHDYPMTGAGVGNFQYAFPKFQDVKHKQVYFVFGHNDWVQFLAETGIVGMCLLLMGMAWFVSVYLRFWLRQNDSFAVCLGAVGIAAPAAVAIHSYSDFNLHIPANFMIFVAVLAIGAGALRLEKQHQHQKEVLTIPSYYFPLRQVGAVLLCLQLGLILWCGQWLIRHFVAEAYCNTVPNNTMNLDQNPPVESIQQAIRIDYGNASYFFKMANALTVNRDKEAQKSGIDHPAWYASHRPIIQALETAIRRNPLDAEAHKRLGWEYTYLWKEPDYMSVWMTAADISMERAAYFAGDWVLNPRIHVDLGHYYTMRSRTLLTDIPKNQALWQKAMHHYGKAMELIGNKTLREEIRRYVKVYYPDDEEKLKSIGGLLPS